MSDDPNMDYERRDAMLEVVHRTYAPGREGVVEPMTDLPEQDIYGPGHDADSPSHDWVEGYRAGRAEAAQRALDDRKALIESGIEAFRLTREYVGEETLPALPGWSWFDWTEQARIFLATLPSEPVSRERVAHDHEAQGCEYPCNVVAGTMEPRR